MTTPTVCEELADLLPGHAMDALNAPEHELVAAHLARCPDCAAIDRELQEVSSQLALAMVQVAPPPSLGAKIMAEARRDLAPERRPVAAAAPAGGLWGRLQ